MRLKALVVCTLLCLLSFPALSQDAAKPAPKKAAPAAQDAKKEAAKPAAAVPAKSAPQDTQKKGEAKPAADQAQAGAPDEGGPGGPRGPRDPMSTPTFNGLRFRSIGPALTSGRVSCVAVDPKDPAHYFVGAASGGVWKTVNNGATFTPVFDSQTSYSIGAIALDPKDPAIVWVGTGEGNSQRSVAYGDGVYRSEDAGRSWKNMGLKKSEHIHRIVIDPRDTKIVYVAAQGPLWGPGGDRGLFKTIDAGKTWKSILPNVSENTGVTDVVLDPENPDVIYAATYQRRRHVFTLINGGPEGAIYKSTDSGATWTRLRSGLPAGDLGRIGLAVAPTDPRIVYATIEAAEGRGGIFRSDDRGATWQRRNPFEDQGQYYGQVFVDPKNVDRIYVMNVQIMLSDDGGRTLRGMATRAKHVDNHAWWVDPNNNDHYLNGNDGGLYESWDRGVNWTFKQNLPITQFYDVAVDMGKPYYVYGGTQDNNSLGGPSRTRGMTGPMNSDWFVTAGGDGFDTEVDPQDPNTVYSESQYGGLVRFDRRTGTGVDIQPQEMKADPANRWNWDSPIVLSPHSHTRLYFASQRLYRSDDRGDSWKAVSADLTRQIDRNKLPVMGKVWGADAVAKNVSTSFYGNIVALDESPKKEGLLYVGTDDGLIQITENGGETWTKYEKFPGIPENTYVSRLKASPHDANVVFAAFDNHKNADFKPYLLKSTDAGKTWTSIAANLPENGPVLAFAQDTVNPNLYFAGTEFGVFFSINGGQKWIQLKGNFPTISVHDIVIHPREGDLVLATFGRGFYILDDITPLRVLKPEMLNQPATIFPIKTAVMSPPSRTQSRNGSDHYAAENPPSGAVFTYFVKDRMQTKKDLRQQAERAAERRGDPMPYPTKDQLRAEAEEEAPQLFAMIYDAQGTPIRRLSLPGGQGIQRTTWDMRYPAPNPVQVAAGGGGGGRGGFGGGAGGGGEEEPPPEFAMFRQSGGPLVMSGQYSVKIFKKQDGKTTEVAGPQTFTVVAENDDQIKPQDRANIVAFQKRVANLYRAVSGTLRATDELQTRLQSIKRALQETPAADPSYAQVLDKMEQQLRVIMRNLRGDQIIAARNYEVSPSINDRVSNVMGNTRFLINPPRQADVDNLNFAAVLFSAELASVRALLDTDLPKLEKGLEASGAPWTPGRLPEFVDKP